MPKNRLMQEPLPKETLVQVWAGEDKDDDEKKDDKEKKAADREGMRFDIWS